MEHTLSNEQIKSFKENGYLIIPNVLSKEQVEYLRSRILGIFSSGEWQKSPYNTERVLSDVYNTFPDFIDLTLNKKVIDIVRSLLQTTPVLMPETAIHYKFYTGWHKDTSSQEREGKTFHWNDDALLLQCGFYLQDNDELGGGLTVMQGSHKTKDNLIETDSFKLNLAERAKLKLGMYKEEEDVKLNPNKHKIVDVASKAGDFVIFDFRLNHRATKPKNIEVSNIPLNKSKIAFFNAFCVDNNTASEYLDFIKSRKEPFYQSLKTRVPSEDLSNSAKNLNFKAL